MQQAVRKCGRRRQGLLMIRSEKGHCAFYSCQAANRSNIWISGQGLKCILLKPKLKHKKAHGLVKPDLMSPSRGSRWGRENGAGVEWISDICLLWEETLSKAILGVTASESLSSEELQKATLLSLGQGRTENEPFKMKMNPGQYSEISSHLLCCCFVLFFLLCSAVLVVSLEFISREGWL